MTLSDFTGVEKAVDDNHEKLVAIGEVSQIRLSYLRGILYSNCPGPLIPEHLPEEPPRYLRS